MHVDFVLILMFIVEENKYQIDMSKRNACEINELCQKGEERKIMLWASYFSYAENNLTCYLRHFYSSLFR